MPESPEVEALAAFLDDDASGREIRGVDVLEFRTVKTRATPPSALVGRTITGAVRHGKHVELKLDDGRLVVSLGRHGWMRWLVGGEPVPAPEEPPALAALELSDAAALQVTDAGTWVSLGLFVVADPAEVPAVVIDLDDGSQAFAPQRLATAPAAVAEGLAGLRQAGFVVLWITRLPASRASDVARALRVSGLDPQGEDQLLLLRNASDRKELLREDASKDVCVVAIAGDERGDFDELFDYLRDPRLESSYDAPIGAGWFLVPPLLDAPATSQ